MTAMISEDTFISYDQIKRSSKIIMPDISPNVSMDATNIEHKIPSCKPKMHQIAKSYSKTNNSSTNSKNRIMSGSQNNNGAVEIIGVMSKMSLLVLFASLTSILGNIGNVFIEIHLLQTIDKFEIDVTLLWAEILPLIDMIVTSFMLYLQFNFTDKTYRALLGHLDTVFLKSCLSVLRYFWFHSKDEEKASTCLNSEA